jgi:asparagine synthase (glutamine-hydrolysing)
VFKTAAELNLKVMLDGQGSDEYLGGYNEFIGTYFDQLLRKGKVFTAFRFLKQRSILLNTSFSRLVKMRLSSFFRSHHQKIQDSIYWTKFGQGIILQKKSYSEFKSLNDLSIHEILQSSIPYQLHSEDRNSMLWSIESRLPFLDYRVIELVLSLPSSYKVRSAKTKSLLRDAMKGILPDAIVNRHDKLGFPAPDEAFFREHAKDLRPILVQAVKRFKHIATEEIIHAFDQFSMDAKPYNPIFMRLISLFKWSELFKVQCREA